MLALFGLLVLVLVAMRVAARPEMWSWLFSGQDGEPNNGRAGAPEDPGARGTRGSEPPLDPGEHRIGPAEDAETETTADDTPGPDEAGTTASGSRSIAADGDLSVDERILQSVEDETPGVRYKEADAYYRILARADRVSQQTLQEASRDVPFSVLMASPGHYRGTPITIEGEVRSVRPLPEGKNDHGVDPLYEAWIFTPGSDKTPCRVVFSQLPDEIAPAERIDERVRVRVAGYFFKIQTYETAGGERTAPLVLAKRLWYVPPSNAATRGFGLTAYVLAFALVIAVSVGVAVWRFSAGDKKFERDHLRRLTEAPREQIDALDDIETTDPHEVFRRLAAEDKESPRPD